MEVINLRSIRAAVAGLALLYSAAPTFAENVLIETQQPAATAARVRSLGGVVYQQYKYIPVISASVPNSAIRTLRAELGPNALKKDVVLNTPGVPKGRPDGSTLEAVASAETVRNATAVEQRTFAATPNSYLITNTVNRVEALHAQGFTGAGMRVAIIDSGLRPGFPHIAGSVLGGEDLVGDGLGFSNFSNSGHGTFVNGIISSHVILGFGKTTGLANAIRTHCPTCIQSETATTTFVPMIGTAPDAKTYHLRVFGPSGGGPTSRILAAMERVIQLRENFDQTRVETQLPNGSYSSLNVKVANMSLGGLTGFAAGELTDKLTVEMLNRDILVTISAGNEGPSGSTIGSPGTGVGALTVGASSSPVNERILREVTLGVGQGVRFRPFNWHQMAYFSSRGPTADGRQDPEIVANGFANFGMGLGSTISSVSLSSGTSYSSPAVAGIAAVLRGAYPDSNAKKVRNALILSANRSILADGSGVNDQGAGHVDADFARLLLFYGVLPETGGATGVGAPQVARNVLESGADVVSGNVTRSTGQLLPGQRYELYYNVFPDEALTVTLSNVQKGAIQNPIFGDDILLTVHDSETGGDDYHLFNFTSGGTFQVPNASPGLVRVTVSGDWTNASPISATINAVSSPKTLPPVFRTGAIFDGQVVSVPFTVPAGVAQLVFRLDWRQDWGRYPSNDIDLVLQRPNGTQTFAGATSNTPEIVVINNPPAGSWIAHIDGYAVYTERDDYELRISADGAPLVGPPIPWWLQ